jgi:hypothetical protein
MRLTQLLPILFAATVWLAHAAEPLIQPRHAEGIKNLFQANDRVFSGSQPEGDEAFAALQKLGLHDIHALTLPPAETYRFFRLRADA